MQSIQLQSGIMKQYDSVPGVKEPFCKAPDVQNMCDEVLYAALTLKGNPLIKRIKRIIRNDGFEASEKRFNMQMEKS